MKGVAMTNAWLDEHLETFVRPVLGRIPEVNPADTWIKVFTPRYLIAINLIWEQATRLARGRTILLPGRDVFLFEVIARIRDDYPTIFRPDISSAVAPFVTEDYSDCFVLDTGYKGSIPKMMKIPNWSLVRYDFQNRRPEDVARWQVFPKAKSWIYSGLSSNLEACPKYWTRASWGADSKKPIQGFDTYYFPYAAALTIHVARSVRERRLPWRGL